MADQSHQVTRLLEAVRANEAGAADRLFREVYDELHTMAAARMRSERPGHILQPTALVSEVYLRLFNAGPPSLDNRRHFFAAAAEAMRRILVEDARSKGRLKRGGGRDPIGFEAIADLAGDPGTPLDLLALDEVLKGLESESPRAAEAIKLRCFAGLTNSQIAEVSGASERTVYGDLAFARAWLHDRLYS